MNNLCFGHKKLDIDLWTPEFVHLSKCCLYNDEVKLPIEDVIAHNWDLTYLNNYYLSQQKMVPFSNAICKGFSKCPVGDLEDNIIDSVNVNQCKCNLKCYMCPGTPYVDDKIKDLYFNVLKSFKGKHLKTLALTNSGEPFFWKKETFEFLNEIDSSFCENLNIITNGTLLEPEDIKHLELIQASSGVKIHVVVSMSGITPETYKIMHCNSAFEKVKRNILLLRDASLLDHVNVVLSKNNIHEIYDIIHFWQNENVALEVLTIRGVETDIIENHPDFNAFKAGFALECRVLN